MAGSSFLTLTNKLLNRLNEVTLNEFNFNDLSIKGIHSAAKIAIQDAVSSISLAEQEWPFNAYQHTQTLLIGVNEYVWPDGFRTADWSSFELLKNDTLNTKSQYLRKINRDEWYSNYRSDDYDNITSGVQMPLYVFDTHGIGFGVTPNPNKEYPISFRYYKDTLELNLPDDTVLIPTKFDYAIISKALSDMYTFLDNTERSVQMYKKYQDELNIMRTVLINKPERMVDTRVQR